MRVLVFAAAAYLVAPGHPDIALAGLPLGQAGTTLLILLIATWAWTRGTPFPAPRPSLTGVVFIAIAMKLMLAAVVPQSGWLAEYFANDRFEPPVQRSLDFRGLNATRIDRQLSFADKQFPVHFFNDVSFNFGFRREVTEPFSVYWRGHLENAQPLTLDGEARGDLIVAVDSKPTVLPAAIDPGTHVIEVRYRKPRDVEGSVRVSPRDEGGVRSWRIGEVTPQPVPSSRRSLARFLAVAAWLLHAAVAIVVVVGLRPAVVARAGNAWTAVTRDPIEGLHHWVPAVVLLLLTAQGLWKSRHLIGHVWTLTGGDDWWAFESGARDVWLNGWLMNNGLEGGIPFFMYPGYAYFLAAVHGLTGESIAGLLLANFVILAGATILVYLLARELVTPIAAYLAVVWLLLLEQLAFVRYYTVTLLSENLFFILVAATLYFLVRFMSRWRAATVAMAGVCGGLATATRPTMMLYLPVAMLLVGYASLRRDGWHRSVLALLLLVVLWMTAISPITLRNYVVSGRPVLVTEGQGRTFIYYNMPAGDDESLKKYFVGFTGSNLSAVTTLLQIFWDYPAATLRQWGHKLGFSLGMVHWHGSSPHPELLLTSALYILSIVLVSAARTLRAMVVHAFVATHLSTLLLTVPWNYGYRMLLAMFLVMPIFAAALVARPLAAWLGRRYPGRLTAT